MILALEKRVYDPVDPFGVLVIKSRWDSSDIKTLGNNLRYTMDYPMMDVSQGFAPGGEYHVIIRDIDPDYLLNLVSTYSITPTFDIVEYVEYLERNTLYYYKQSVTKSVNRIEPCDRHGFFSIGGDVANLELRHGGSKKFISVGVYPISSKCTSHNTVKLHKCTIGGYDAFMGGSPQDAILRMGFRRYFEIWGKCKIYQDKPNDIARGLCATKEQIASIGGLIGKFNAKKKIKKNAQGEWTPVDIAKIYPEIPLLSSEAVTIIRNRAKNLANSRK